MVFPGFRGGSTTGSRRGLGTWICSRKTSFLFPSTNRESVTNHRTFSCKLCFRTQTLVSSSAHWYLAVICFPGLEGPVYQQNPLYHDPFPASSSASDARSEENIPDHCRPLSPDRDRLDSSSEQLSPGVPETSAEPNGEEELPSSAPDNGHVEQQYTSESQSL